MHPNPDMALAEVTECLKNSTLCEVLTDQGEWKTTMVVSIAAHTDDRCKIGVIDPSKMYWRPVAEVNPDSSYRGEFKLYPHYHRLYPGEIPKIYLSGRDITTRLRKREEEPAT